MTRLEQIESSSSPIHLALDQLESTQGAVGVFAGDILHSPIQVRLWEWSTRVRWDKRMAAASRRELLEFCASENHFCCAATSRRRTLADQTSGRHVPTNFG
jgi:hypothetical protein